MQSKILGVDFQRIRLNVANASREREEYQLTQGLEGFLAGRANTLIAHPLGPVANGLLISTKKRGWRRILLGWFVQDDIRVSSKLTLNLGLRHEFFTAPYEVNGRTGNLPDPLTSAASIIGPPFHTKKATFAPRLGVAWDPTGSGKTSIRGGAGLFYNHIDGRTYYSQSGDDPNFRAVLIIANPAFPRVDVSTIPLTDRSTGSVQKDIDTPSVVHYSFEIQRELVPTVSVRAGFIGSHGYNMARLSSPNRRAPQILPDGSLFFAASGPRINLNFTEITQLRADATSNYHSLQFEVQKAFSHGLMAKVAYTLGKNLANADSISTSQILTTPSAEMHPFDLDRPNLAPGASNDPHEGVTAGCPGVPAGQKLGTPDRWFDPCAFTLPAVGTYGNLARTTVGGPNFINLDMGLTKDTPLGERMSLQFRAEFFNLINHANFGRFLNLIFSNATARSGNAGRISETVTVGREIQFGLKLTF